MEDDKSVGELKVDNDRVVFMVFKKDGIGSGACFFGLLTLEHRLR
jgi:hypothetical protein